MSCASLQVHSHTYLGVTIPKNLSWDEQKESLAVKAGPCLDVLNYIVKHYRLYILHLYGQNLNIYANIVWDNCQTYMYLKVCSTGLQKL